MFSKESGVLLHITSLPGKWGIGTLGSEAFQFADWLVNTTATVWQVLPISPPVFSYSPYQALSSFAGNPLIISPEELYKDGFLTSKELLLAERENHSKVFWADLVNRNVLLEVAAKRALDSNMSGFDSFFSLSWVKRWSYFAAMKRKNQDKSWLYWRNLSEPTETEMKMYAMIQFFFQKQWNALRKYCNGLGIKILGDIPIYTAHDSSDVYFNKELFKLKENGSPDFVAGVPPDYFSKDGQLWGNPVYDWEKNAFSDYNWWISRVERALELYDFIRIDHFRAFDEYWEIPSGETSAIKGKWQKGPGLSFFKKLEERLGNLPIVAEDLGLITESVITLRKNCGFPGMTVLQFALQDPNFSISNVEENSVIYTGTHDNDTSVSWIESIGIKNGYDNLETLVSLALNSKACLAVIPMQDILGLGSFARMNKPSSLAGNWSWRLKKIPLPYNLSRHT